MSAIGSSAVDRNLTPQSTSHSGTSSPLLVARSSRSLSPINTSTKQTVKTKIKKALLFATGVAIDTTGVGLGLLTHDPYSIYSASCKLVSNTQSGFATLIDKEKDINDQSKMMAETSLQGSISSGGNWLMSRITPSWNTPSVVAKVIAGTIGTLAANQVMSKVIVPKLLGQKIEHFNFTKENFKNCNPDATKKSLVVASTIAGICGTIGMTGTGLLGNKVLSAATLSAGNGNALSAFVNVARSVFDKGKSVADTFCSARDLVAGILVSCVGDVAVGHSFKALKQHPAIAWPLIMGGTLGLNQAIRSALSRFSSGREANVTPTNM